jgi:hypothetical protein
MTVPLGITPKITNEVGIYVDGKPHDVALLPRNTRNNVRRLKSINGQKVQSNVLTAVPNDRARSIGPGDRRLNFK